MTGKTLLVVCGIFFATLASAEVVRDGQGQPEVFPFFNLFATAGDTWKMVQNNLFKVVGVKDEQQFNEYVAGEAKAYATNFDTLFKDIKKTADENVEKFESSGPVMHLRTTVNEAIGSLKKVNPVAGKNIDQFTTNTKHFIEGISDIGDSDAAKQINEIGTKIMETAVETLKVTNNQIQQSMKKLAFADDNPAELPKILLDEVRANADVILKEVRSKMMENLDIVANETLKSISLVESLVGAIETETGGALKELLSALDVQPAKNNAADVLTEKDLVSQVDEIKKSAQNLVLGIIKVLVKQMHENKTNKMQHQLVNEKLV